jgi:hypothetical protein
VELLEWVVVDVEIFLGALLKISQNGFPCAIDCISDIFSRSCIYQNKVLPIIAVYEFEVAYQKAPARITPPRC